MPQCIALSSDEVIALINDSFGAGTPDANAALGKWDNIGKQKAHGNTSELTAKTWSLVDFMLTKRRQAGLPLTDDFQKLVNYLFCFAGIDSALPDGNAWIVYNTDGARTLVTDDGQAGLLIPAGAVDATSLIAITQTAEPLRTDLDTYPTNYEFSKYPSNVFSQSVTAGLCATAPDDVLARMVLGHNTSDGGFELLVKQPVSFLSCSSTASRKPLPSMLDRLVALVLPKVAYAAIRRGAVGVGGSVLEFSEIGPVDPLIKVTANPIGTAAPAGGLLSPAPSVTLQTENGTPLSGIPVTFATSNPGASIGPSPVISAADGVASVASWQLGAPGVNTATATPGLGGAAVPGVIFDAASHTFTATASSTLVAFGSGGYSSYGPQAPGGSAPAGWPTPTAAVSGIVGSQSPFRGASGVCAITSGSGTTFPADQEIFVVKSVDVPVAGTLQVTVHVDNDVRIWVDGVERTHMLTPTANYAGAGGFWAHEGCADIGPPVGAFAVAAGTHTISLWARDRGTVGYLDMKVELTNP